MGKFEIVINWEAEDIESAILTFRRQFPQLKERVSLYIDADKFGTINENLETKNTLEAIIKMAEPHVSDVDITSDWCIQHHLSHAITGIKNKTTEKKHKDNK